MSAPISFRRMAAIAAVAFVLILAFLAGRVNGGADPAQAGTPAARVAPAATPEPQESEEHGDEPDEDDPSGQWLPAPDQGSVPSPGGQDPNPPTTQAS